MSYLSIPRAERYAHGTFQLQNKNDPNLSMCPADHPFINVAALETEGVKMLERIITLLYTNSYAFPHAPFTTLSPVLHHLQKPRIVISNP